MVRASLREPNTAVRLSMRYTVAILMVVAAWLVRTALIPAIGVTALPFITFFPAVAGATWYGGLGAGLVATALSAIAADWFFFEPVYASRPSNVAAYVGFPLSAGIILASIALLQRTRADLIRTRDTLLTTLRSIGDGVIVTDAQGRVTFINDEAERLTGWKKEEAHGRPLADVFRIVNELTQQKVENPVEKVLQHGNVVGLANHTVLVARDGSSTPIDDSAAPITGPGQPIEGVVLVFRDVREQRLAETAQARLAAIVESSGDAIVSKSIDGIVQTWNAAAERLFGYRADEIIGRSIATLIPPDRLDEERMILERLRQDRGSELIETIRLTKDGRRIPVSVRVSPIHDSEGKVIGASKTARDLSPLIAVRDTLREADQRKNEFLATLAHELRNPLAPIRNSVALLHLKGPRERELVEARLVIDRQVEQMSRLLDDLLDVSRLDRQKLQIRKEPVALSSVIASAMETARPEIERRHHEVTMNVPDDVVIDADPLRLSQVFANLLNNAAKYTEKGGHIWVNAERTDSNVDVVVRDNGMGISPEALPRLFQMFTQVSGSVERAETGAGIGLALAQGLVELHGGTITAVSNGLGTGSEFRVRLPMLLDASVPEAPARAQPFRIESPTRRIVIADDVRDNADTLAMLLRAYGHEVEVAYDGAQAVLAAESFRPDVALFDIAMPVMTGFEACREIRSRPWGESVYMIAQTGWGHDDDRKRAREAGFDHHLLKPIDSTSLLTLLAGPLRRSDGVSR